MHTPALRLLPHGAVAALRATEDVTSTWEERQDPEHLEDFGLSEQVSFWTSENDCPCRRKHRGAKGRLWEDGEEL